MGRTQSTIMGPETDDEMCWNILSYWPLQRNLRCADESTTAAGTNGNGGGAAVAGSTAGSTAAGPPEAAAVAMWAGNLTATEDVRVIAVTHPASKSLPGEQYPRANDLESGGVGVAVFERLDPNSEHPAQCYAEDLAGLPTSPVALSVHLAFVCGDAQGGIINRDCLKLLYGMSACICPRAPGRDALDPSMLRAILGTFEMSLQTQYTQMLPADITGCLRDTRVELALLDATGKAGWTGGALDQFSRSGPGRFSGGGGGRWHSAVLAPVVVYAGLLLYPEVG